MSDPEETRAAEHASEHASEEDEEEEYASTPFDNPFFLPVILIAFAIWFIYDGWFNPEMEWIKFNRVGAAITSVLGVYFTVKALRERRAAAEDPLGPDRR